MNPQRHKAKETSDQGKGSGSVLRLASIRRPTAQHDIANGAQEGRYYSAMERQLLTTLVESREYERTIPFGRIVPDWNRIAEAFNLSTGRKISGRTIKNYYCGELKGKQQILRDKRARAEAKVGRLKRARAFRQAERKRISHATGRSHCVRRQAPLPLSKNEAGVSSALARGELPYRLQEDNTLLSLASTQKVESGPNKGRIDWENIVEILGQAFPPMRTKQSYQARLRKLGTMR